MARLVYHNLESLRKREGHAEKSVCRISNESEEVLVAVCDGQHNATWDCYTDIQ
jgi:hypothetical protein